MVRYVHKNSGSYDYLKEMWNNVAGWFEDNKEYVKSQIPYYADYKKFTDDAQFWKDYKKNTGFSPRYPNRVYGSAGVNLVYSTSRLFRSMKRLYG